MSTFWLMVQSVAPIFFITSIGTALRLGGMIDTRFIRTSSEIVFRISLPCLLFLQIARTDFSGMTILKEIGFVVGTTLLSFWLIWAIAKRLISRRRDVGTFVQGAFRSNYAIFGFAIIQQTLGPEALGVTSLIMAVVVPLYNLLSVVVLLASGKDSQSVSLRTIVTRIFQNPLILSILGGLLVSLLRIPMPRMLVSTFQGLSELALPLALIGIGSLFDPAALTAAPRMAITASLIKVCLMPLCFTPLAVWMGFRGSSLAALFVLFASPTAIASFIMAGSMNGNPRLAGDIILLSTLASMVTLTVGLFILKQHAWI